MSLPRIVEKTCAAKISGNLESKVVAHVDLNRKINPISSSSDGGASAKISNKPIIGNCADTNDTAFADRQKQPAAGPEENASTLQDGNHSLEEKSLS